MTPQLFLRKYGILLLPVGLGALVVLGFLGWYVNFMWNSALMGASDHYGKAQVQRPQLPPAAEYNLGR